MVKLVTPQDLHHKGAKIPDSIDALAEFNMHLDLPIPFLPELLVRSAAKIKGWYKGADYGLICSQGESSDEMQYSLFVQYFPKSNYDLKPL